jgi:secondary thiamine-phosphate synthase enzyme
LVFPANCDTCQGMKTIAIRAGSRTAFVDITAEVADCVRAQDLGNGVVTIFIPHTTAGVTINENADPDVTADMELVLDRMVPWTGGYAHGEGNTAAHVKASMMGSSVQVIVADGRLQLGTWQAIYFCEFDGPRARKVLVKAG